MSIEKLIEFSKTGAKNTDDLNLEAGFPVKLQPARQWMNWLFNSLTRKINELIDKSLDLDEKKLNKEDLASGDAPVFAARAWGNFNGSTAAVRKSGNIKAVTRNSTGNYTITFTNPMPHADYVVLTNVSNFGAGTTFGVVSQTADGFVLQATYGGDNTIGSFDRRKAVFHSRI